MNAIYNRFIRRKRSIDVCNGKLRPEIRTMALKTRDTALMQMLLNRPKTLSINTLSPDAIPTDPLASVRECTNVQRLAIRHAEDIMCTGAVMYKSSCGSGKTLAGIYYMYKLQCKTLIISSRSAINDQWKHVLSTMYPNLRIVTRTDRHQPFEVDADVYIYSPQYLTRTIDGVPLYRRIAATHTGDTPAHTTQMGDTSTCTDGTHTSDTPAHASDTGDTRGVYASGTPLVMPSLIIYDEIHSLVAETFQGVLMMPFEYVLSGVYSELPIMIAMSATPPLDHGISDKIFGRVYETKAPVTDIPVYIQHHGELPEYAAIETLINAVDTEIRNDRKGIIMTYTIDSSVYAALLARSKWSTDVLLVREAGAKCIHLRYTPDHAPVITSAISLADLRRDDSAVYCDMEDVIDDVPIIVSTVQRLKEGFSRQDVTWGIISKFVWSISSRVQLLGRVRRMSDDDALNSHRRIVHVCTSPIPTTFGSMLRRGMSYIQAKTHEEVAYDVDAEARIFNAENYVYVSA